MTLADAYRRCTNGRTCCFCRHIVLSEKIPLLVTRFWTIVGTILPLFLWVFSFQLVWFSWYYSILLLQSHSDETALWMYPIHDLKLAVDISRGKNTRCIIWQKNTGYIVWRKNTQFNSWHKKTNENNVTKQIFGLNISITSPGIPLNWPNDCSWHLKAEWENPNSELGAESFLLQNGKGQILNWIWNRKSIPSYQIVSRF